MIYLGSIWSCNIDLSEEKELAIKLVIYSLFVWKIGRLCKDFNKLSYFLSGMFTIFNVWLLGRWCDSLNLWYSVDAFTIYLLVWQISYLIAKWCYHELPWPSFILYQGSICIISAIESFLIYDLYFRYFPSITLVLFWILSVYDM